MTTTQHPERRAGQRWRSKATIGGKPYVVEGTLLRYEDFGQQLGNGWHIAAATVNGKSRDDGGYVFYDKNWNKPNRPMTLLSDVPAAAPLAADRAGCKAPTWCDFDDAPDSKDPRIQVYIKAEDGNYGVRRGHRIYCSGTCAPPLAAQPAETKPIEECGYPIGSDKAPCVYSKGHGGRHWPAGPNGERASKPAPQPAPACAHGCGDVQVNTACPTHGKPAPAKPVRCIGIAASSAHECRGPSLVRMVGAIRGVMCERWMMTLETKASDWTPNSGLTPYTGPERLERARLAHSSMWADEAEDVR